MDPTVDVCESLLKWLETLVPNQKKLLSEVNDGVAILQALLHISPEHFGKLQGKIKHEVGNNWRLKVSNLKKIIEAITEYYQDVLSLQLLDMGRPDVVKLGETGDLIQLGKLLRLLLGCAVNCERKQDYITEIMALEEQVQRCIMQAIQQLEELTGRSGLSLLSLEQESRIGKLIVDLENANEFKDNLAQKCHNLEMQVQTLQEEKQALIADNQLLAVEIKQKQTSDNPRGGLENRRQTDLLKEEIFKLETIRDDYRAKVLEQEKQIFGFQEKIGELQLAIEDTARLKDEVDALKESADKVKTLEIAVNSYKKKLEDYADVKKQLKILEDKNVEYLQQNMKYEEELKKHNIWKNQSELYKSQVAELQQKLDEETGRSDKLVFSNKNLESKLEAVQAEKDRTARERDVLREENDELRVGGNKGESGAAMAQELAPTEMKERLRFLEKENRQLRATNQDAESKQVRLDDALARLEKLSEQNRSANQRILELEAHNEELKKDTTDGPLASQESELVKEYKQKIVSLQEALSVKDAKYHRNLEKAREVALSLQSATGKSNGSLESIRHNRMKEEECHLLTSAFYNMCMQCHREAVDDKLAMLSAGQGQSFLSRQRQPTPRKAVTSYKSK